MMDSGGVPFTMNVEPAGTSNNGGNCGWGGDGAWWIIILFLFVFCGWGNGFGGYGNVGGANSPGFQGYATRADINDGFAMNNLQSGINAIQQGICDATYALTNAVNSGFSNMQLQICNLGSQLAQCCCDIRASIQDVRYEMAKSTCDITNQMSMNTRDVIDNQNNGFRSILDYLCQEKIDAKNEKIAEQAAQIQTLQLQASQAAQNAVFAASQEAQTAELIRRLGKDYPVNAVVVQPSTPVTFPVNGCGNWNGCGNGCNGCGNVCMG